MIQIKRFVFNMIEENTYIIWDDSLECVIIDCGAFYEEERQTIVKTTTLNPSTCWLRMHISTIISA